MEMPAINNDQALSSTARVTHAPHMGKLSRRLGTVCIEVLGDYTINDLRTEVKDLQQVIHHQTLFIEELLTENVGNLKTTSPVGVCNLCYKVDIHGNGVCPCGLAHYCSEECQKIDWKRHHKSICTFLPRGVPVRVPPLVTVDDADDQSLEIID